MARDVRRPGRWDYGCRTPRRRGLVDGDRVIGGVSGDAHERTLDRGEQLGGGGRSITRRLRSACERGSRLTDSTPRWSFRQPRLPRPPCFAAAHSPAPTMGQTRAVEHEMEALAGRHRSQTAPQMLTAPGERRIVGNGEVEAHSPERYCQVNSPPSTMPG